jgi:hypothetical protein
LKKLALLIAVVLVSALPATAQLPPFDAEIDCGGVFMPGDSVPFTARFENQTFAVQDLDTTITLSIPGLGERTLFNRPVRLNPNQDRSFTKNLNLRASSPTGSYTMSITASNGTDVAFDTCSFNVVP